ncbi:MAG: DUF2322 family protein [Rhodoferax sp.]|nr:DUF2322 family protein [Rhodoferax sp.]
MQLHNRRANGLPPLRINPVKPAPVAVYAALAASMAASPWQRHGKELALFAEHTANARANPGNHPNIDRLLEVVAAGQVMASH